MKVLRIPCFILLLLLVFSLCNSTAVSSRCHDWATQIDAIDQNAEAQRWSAAADGLDAADGGLVGVLAAGRAADALVVGVEAAEQEVTVGNATPAPVDVVVAVAGIAVADKGVAALGAGAG